MTSASIENLIEDCRAETPAVAEKINQRATLSELRLCNNIRLNRRRRMGRRKWGGGGGGGGGGRKKEGGEEEVGSSPEAWFMLFGIFGVGWMTVSNKSYRWLHIIYKNYTDCVSSSKERRLDSIDGWLIVGFSEPQINVVHALSNQPLLFDQPHHACI